MCTLCEEKQKYSGRERVERNGLWKNGNEPTNKTTEKKESLLWLWYVHWVCLRIFMISALCEYTQSVWFVCVHTMMTRIVNKMIFMYTHMFVRKGESGHFAIAFFYYWRFSKNFLYRFWCAHTKQHIQPIVNGFTGKKESFKRLIASCFKYKCTLKKRQNEPKKLFRQVC